MSFPSVRQYEITASAGDHVRFMRMAEAFGWKCARIYSHPTNPGRSIAESVYGMPREMLGVLSSADPLYAGPKAELSNLIRRAQSGENTLAEINNAMVTHGLCGRIALDYALRDALGASIKHVHPKSMAGRIMRLSRRISGQMMLGGMEPSESHEETTFEDYLSRNGGDNSPRTLHSKPMRIPYQVALF